MVVWTEHTECQAFCPVVQIGSPNPHRQESVAPPPFGSKGGDTLGCRGGVWGGPNSKKGQTLWYRTLFIILSLYGLADPLL